jgi:site-specific recombinase XerD
VINADRPVSDSTTGAFEAAEEEVPRRSTFRRHFGKHEIAKHLVAAGCPAARWSRLWVARIKGSLSVEHPIAGDELRAIKRYLATREDNLPWLFVSERQAQLTRQAVNYIVRLASEKAKLGRVWPHMLRHSCGYYLADQGTDLRTMLDYLGHRDPKHTAHYTRVAGHRFEGLWKN